MKKLLLAAVAALATAMPAMATVDPNTNNLLAQIEGHGIEVVINTKQCEMRNIHGSYSYSYRTNVRTMTLCPGESVDAIDHSTVRHETVHAIQHCTNILKRKPLGTPILDDPEEFQRMVVDNLDPALKSMIQEYYPRAHWEIEYEAWLLERVMTAEELMTMFDQTCGRVSELAFQSED